MVNRSTHKFLMKKYLLLLIPFCIFAMQVQAITSASISAFTNATCGCCATGSATVVADNGSGNYSYLWSNGQQSQTAINLVPGNYTATVTDLQDNSTASASVSIGPPPSITPSDVPTTACAGSAWGISYSLCGNFNADNVFTAYLSDVNGNFSSQVNIGSVAADAVGNLNIIFPIGTPPGYGYMIEVDGSDPPVTGYSNGMPINITPGLSFDYAPTYICAGTTAFIYYIACAQFDSSNIFTAYLSDSTGSFASPVALDTVHSFSSGPMNVVIPANTPPGIHYRIAVYSSNPYFQGTDNGFDITINPASIVTLSEPASSLCSGGQISVPYEVPCIFNTDNVFTAQLSDGSGSFNSPVNIGTLASTGSGTINANIPGSISAGTGYLVRVISSDPVATGTADSSNLIINSNPPTIVTGDVPVLCSGGIDVPFTVCGGFNAGNIFTVQLSNASGSFAAPVNIGSLSSVYGGTIYANVPLSTPTGSGYRVRVISSSPAITGNDNGTDLSINMADATHSWNWAEAVSGSIYPAEVTEINGNACDIAADQYGNSYLVGSFNMQGTYGATTLTSFGGYDVFVAKMDSNGNILWVKNFGGRDDDVGKSIAVDPLGNPCITGFFQSDTMFLGSVMLIHDGGPASASASHNNTGRSTIFIAKFDPSGNVLWAKKAGGNQTDGNFDYDPNDRGMGITTDLSGNILVTGGIGSDTAYFDTVALVNTESPTSIGRTFTAKYSPSGNVIWAKDIPIYGQASRGVGIACDPSGDVFVTGGADGIFKFAGKTDTTSAYDIFLVKYDPSGNELWAEIAGSPPDDAARGVAVDRNGDAFITGWLQFYPGHFDTITLPSLAGNHISNIFLAKYNGANGHAEWVRQIQSSGNNPSNAITVDNCDNVYFTGETGLKGDTIRFDSINIVTTLNYGAFVAIYDNTGKALYANLMSGPSNIDYYADFGWGIALDYRNNVLVTGTMGNPSMQFGCLPVSNSEPNGTIFVAKMNNPPDPVGVSISGSLNICGADSTTLTASGSGSYTWSPSAGLNTTTGATVRASPDSTTAYQVTGISGSCYAVATAVVSVNQAPVPTVTIADSLVCPGDSTRVCANGGYGSYLWNTGDTTMCIMATNAGGYWVTASASPGCSSISKHAELSVYPSSTVSIVVQGDTLTSFNSSRYQWYYNNDSITGANLDIYIARKSGNYAVEVIDSNGCRELSSNTQVIINGISEPGANGALNVFPDPFSSSLFVLINTSSATINQVNIYDVTGRAVWSSAFSGVAENPVQLDLSLLPDGTYFIEVIRTGAANYFRQVVKLSGKN